MWKLCANVDHYYIIIIIIVVVVVVVVDFVIRIFRRNMYFSFILSPVHYGFLVCDIL
jgi:hypothetical protein